MTSSTIAFIFQIQFTDEETRAFERKLPGSRDIENFVEESLDKAGVSIGVHESEGTGQIYIGVELDASEFPLYGEARKEIQRIENVFRNFVSEK
jgi:hypothetical protein